MGFKDMSATEELLTTFH